MPSKKSRPEWIGSLFLLPVMHQGKMRMAKMIADDLESAKEKVRSCYPKNEQIEFINNDKIKPMEFAKDVWY